MANSTQGNDVLTKSDKESNFPINFQPMPKRFMIWDTVEKRFLGEQDWVIMPTRPNCGVTRPYENINNPDNIDEECIDWADADLLTGRYLICQSTNLFDKDGEEVFEGHILDNGTCRAICEWDNSNAEFDFKMTKGNDSVKGWLDDYKIIGHALSNPELLEEE